MNRFANTIARARVTASRIKYLFIKRPGTDTDNPYLNARRTWNLHVGSVVYSRFVWQVMCLLCLYIAGFEMTAYHDLAKQSKFVPYVLVPTRNNEALAVGATVPVARTDRNVQMAELRRFVEDWRLVTPDVAVQRKAIDRVYSKLITDEAATVKLNAWFQENPPMQRAEKLVINTQSMTAVWLSKDSVQIDWEETMHDRSGVVVRKPVMWRAVLTARYLEPTSETSEHEMELNPARIFVSDISWTQVATK